MLIKEYRVINNSTEAEYRVAQLYAVALASKNVTGGGEGVEVLKNEPYEDETGKGQYTYKVYYFSSKVPAVLRVLLPTGALEVHEEAWNAFPYCKTVLTNPFMKDNFKMVVETLHMGNDRGELPNALKLSPEDLAKREVITIDVANDPIEQKDYKREEDPKLYHSEKTGRGPLKGDWIKTCTPAMTCYKLLSIEFKWWGLQDRIENFVHKIMRGVFTRFHRQVFCWTDRWIELKMEDIRALEDETQKELDETRNIPTHTKPTDSGTSTTPSLKKAVSHARLAAPQPSVSSKSGSSGNFLGVPRPKDDSDNKSIS